MLAAVDRHRPDVVLMDIRMPAVDGIEATRLLRAQPSPPAVIVLTTFDADELVLRALRAGAAGFLLKDTPPPEIVRAIEHVHAGDGMLSPTVTRRLIALVAGDDGGRREEARARCETLRAREREVACAVGRGCANAEIAAELHMSVATVKAHVSRVLVKLGVENRVQVALLVQDALLTHIWRACANKGHALDEAAFAELYDRHAPPLAAWLRRRSDPDTAQELLAETFAQAWCVRRRFKPERGSRAGVAVRHRPAPAVRLLRRLEVEDRARRKLGVAARSPPSTTRPTPGWTRRRCATELARLAGSPPAPARPCCCASSSSSTTTSSPAASGAPPPPRACASPAVCASCAATAPHSCSPEGAVS